MIDLKDIVAKAISESNSTIEYASVYELLEFPPDEKLGDISLPCFKLSKILRKAPPMIANDIASGLGSDNPLFDKVEVVGGYLNFFISHSAFAKNVVEEVISKENYGGSDIGSGKTVVFDYSSPNIAKPFHIGHLPSTVLGNALYRIYGYMGYNTVGVNHLGDWGTQFGTMIVAYKKWGNKEEVERGGVQELVRLYVKFHQEEENDPSLRDEARYWFSELEKGNKEAYDLWNWFKDVSLEECKRVYDVLGVSFDYYTGESFYVDKADSVVNELVEKNMLIESEGAHVVDLSAYDMPPCIVRKADGSSIYATRDLAAIFYRKNTFDFDKCIYLTATQQNLHFKQVFKVVELMGYEWAKDQLIHAPFGMISLSSGESMSTRHGVTIWLNDVLNQATAKTLEIIKEKNPNMENIESVAQQMGVGAVVFGALSTGRIKDVAFSWEDVLNFDGETGPYVQYTHARACSILRKAEVEPEFIGITSDAEYRVVRELYNFPEKVKLAMEANEPSIVTRYVIDLAQEFNRFYHDCPINSAEGDVKKSRLAITMAVKKVLAKGLWLIGLTAPERV